MRCLLVLPLLLAAPVLLTTWAAPAAAQTDDFFVDLGRGPVLVNVPPGYDPDVPAPLVILLHGYSSSGQGQEDYFQFTPLSDELGFLYAYPDGLIDNIGLRYWNATDACCGVGGDADDSGYLLALVDAIKAAANVDPNRVHFTGHSNGGFMSHRMACDHSEVIASVASFAGAAWLDPADCSPSSPVHVLQAHGTSDATVLFEGGCFGFGTDCYPSAVDSVKQWAIFNECDPVVDASAPNLNLTFLQAGDETQVFKVEGGCLENGSAELWRMNGAGHVPIFTGNWAPEIVDWLLSHPKE